jgi:hypothetical protein
MANSYDRIFKENIESLQWALLRKLLKIDPPKLVPVPAKIQATQEIEMDHIRRVVHDDPALDYALQVEFHIPDEDLRKRNALHYAIFMTISDLDLRQIVIFGGMNTPKHITQNILIKRGLSLAFEVIVLKNIPKEEFINSTVPEEVVMAILCDFGKDKPEEVISKILHNLKKILKKTDKIKKYQKQLVILSRLRKLEIVTKKEVEEMTIHYDIETDGLYLEGIEKGLEQGLEKGLEQGLEKGLEKGLEQGLEKGISIKEREVTLNLWNTQSFPLHEIAFFVGISEEQVMRIISDFLEEQGKTAQEAGSPYESPIC